MHEIYKFNNHERKKTLCHNKPIIIGGCGRSGTTLLLSILSAHNRIFAIPFETRIFCPRDSKNIPYTTADIDFMFLYQYLNYNAVFNKNLRWCEKTPKNVHNFRNIINFFNREVRIINIVRDGRDVITSKHPSLPSQFWVSPSRWIRDVKEGSKYEEDNCVLTIRYEDIVLSFEDTITSVFNFLDLDYPTGYLKLWKNNKELSKAPSISGEIVGLNSFGIGRWKNDIYKGRIEEFERIEETRALLDRYGYE